MAGVRAASERLDAVILRARAAAATTSSDARGQGLAEYALILALIIIVAIVALIFLGGQVKTILSSTGTSV